MNDKKETKKDKKKITKDLSKNINNKNKKRCYMCKKYENEVGKMIQLYEDIYICFKCIQKNFNLINNITFDYRDLMDNVMETGKYDFNKLCDKLYKAKFVNKHEKKKHKNLTNLFDIKNMPVPHIIKKHLDLHVIGQEKAKRIISVAVYNHYKRIFLNEHNNNDNIAVEKSNILIIGPTGSGKTYLIKTLAKFLKVPLAVADATSITEAGYIGDDIESVVSKLLVSAGNDVDMAEHGIIFIDEIDKISKKQNGNQKDVSGEAVQQGMLKLLEGSVVEVPVGCSNKGAMVPLVQVNTKNILFICGGTFPYLENIIKKRLNKNSSIGFMSSLKKEYNKNESLISKATIEDLRQFGMIPEFLGRLPIISTFDNITENMLLEILKKPQNSILKQYERLFKLDNVKLEFSNNALKMIAKIAFKKHTGARALRAILEKYMLDVMYEIPKDKNIGKVIITKEYIKHSAAPKIFTKK